MSKYKHPKIGKELDVFECDKCGFSPARNATTVIYNGGGSDRPKWPHPVIVLALMIGVMWLAAILGALALGYLTKDYTQLIALLDLTKQGLSAVISLLQGGKK